MRTKSLNTKGFAPLVLLIAAVAVLVVGGGAYVYHQNHKTEAVTTTSSTNSSTQTNKNSSTAPTTSNPYAGWQSASLKYEQATFKYPSSWQISNTSKDETQTGGTATPGADSVTLTSPTGLLVSINTGVAGIGDSDGIDSVLSGAQPIQALGGNYYLDFYTNTAISSTEAQGACLDQEATVATGAPYVASKNIQLANIIAPAGDVGNPASDLVCIQYQQVGGQTPEKPVSTFEQDASYADAKLIIESLAY